MPLRIEYIQKLPTVKASISTTNQEIVHCLLSIGNIPMGASFLAILKPIIASTIITIRARVCSCIVELKL